MKRNGAFLRTLTITIILTGAVFTAVFAGALVTARLTEYLQELRGDLMADLEKSLAQEISWESVDPSILRGITVHGVRVSGTTGYAHSVSVGIDLGEILRGDRYRLIPSVTVRYPQVILDSPDDLERLMQTISFVRGVGEGRRVISVRVEKGNLVYVTPGFELAARDVNGTVQLDDSRVHGQLRAALDVNTTFQGDQFSLALGITGTVDTNRAGDPAGVTVEMSRIRGSHVTASNQTVRVERKGTVIAFERVRSQDALDLGARLDLSTQEALVTLRSHAIIPSSLVTFHGPWSHLNDWVSTPITTDSRVRLDLDGSLIEAWGSVAGRVVHSFLPEPVSLEAEYRLTPDRLVFPSLRVIARQGEARFTGAWREGAAAPDGSVQFLRFAYAGSPLLDGSITLSGSTTVAGISSDRIALNGFPIFNLVASLKPGAANRSRYHSLETAFSFDPAVPAHVRGTVRVASLQDFTGQVDLEGLPLIRAASAASAFGYALELPAVLGEFDLNGTVRFDQREQETLIRIAYMTAQDGDDLSRLVAFSGEYRNGEITLSHFFLREQNVTVTGTAEGMLESDGSLRFSTDFAVNHVPYWLDGRYTATGELALSGPHGFEAHLSRTIGGGYGITASSRNAPLPFGQASFSFDLDGVFYDRANWYLNVQEMELRNLPIPGADGEMRRGRVVLAAAIRPETVQVAIIELNDGISVLAGTLDARYYLTGTGPDITLSGRLGGLTEQEELYRFTARYSEGAIALDLRFSASPLVRLASGVEGGTVEGTIQAVGTWREPEIRAFLESDRLIFNGTGASFRLLVQSDASVLRLTQGEFAYGTVLLDVPEMILLREDGIMDGAVRFRRLDQDVSLDITGRTAPITELSLKMLRTTDLDLTVRAESADATGSLENPRAWHYELVRTADATTLSRLDGAIRGTLSDQGAFSLTLAGDLPYRGQATGIVTPDRLEVTVSNIFLDLTAPPLPPALRQFEVSGGIVTGSLRLLGTPGDPDIFGTLTVRNLELTTPFSPDSLGPLDAALIFEEKLVRLQETRGTIGLAPVDLSAQVLINRLALEQFELLLNFPGDTGVHVVNEFGPINMDGYARGNIRLGGTAENLEVTGTITIYGSELAVAQDFEQETNGESNTVLDLRIRTGRAVRFIWPDTELPIIRSNFATGQEVRLRADTGENTFSLDGTLAIQSGDVLYFDRNFLLRSGRIEFRETQDDFDPRVTARAELREATPDGPVRIFLIADGQRLSEFSPRFDSTPPLDNAEIVAVLGGSILQTGSEGTVSLPSALISSSDVVTQFAFFRQFENSVREQLDLDLFAIRTSIVQNILLTAITPAGDDEVQQQLAPSLGTYLNNTSIFMGRYIGDSVFGQVVLQMRASDPLAFPDDDGIQRLGGVLIDSEISLEWQTPFFLLEWNFAPQNPEELFIRDNTFSFLWSFSY